MKIFIDNLLLTDKGGIYVYFQELLKFLKDKDCSLHVDFFDDPDKNMVPESYIIKNKKFLERLRKCHVPNSFDIFHSSYYRLPNNKKTKVVTTVHDFTHQKYENKFRSFINMKIKMRAVKNSDAIICISENTKADLLSFYRPKENQQVHVIYNGISEDYRKLQYDVSYEKYFLFVGHRVDFKNWKLALELVEKQKDFKLIVVGGDPNIEKFYKTIKPSMKHRVVFRGFVSNKDLNDLYNKAFCLFYPSSYEGFGIPVIEAMASGCPVIANDQCKAVREIAGDLPLYFNQKKADFSEVFDHLKVIDREKIINRGLKHALSFSWETNLSEVFKIYKSLYDQKKRQNIQNAA